MNILEFYMTVLCVVLRAHCEDIAGCCERTVRTLRGVASCDYGPTMSVLTHQQYIVSTKVGI